MGRINYQHLFYFWNVAREESVTRASEKLHLAQPTISSQLAVFEKTIGEKLFYKNGRKLVLTDTGRIVFHYADEIFSLGQELANTLKGRPTGRALRLVVGVADALPKLVACRLIEPAFRLPEPVQILCYEDKAERLLAEMSLQGIDLVLSDVPVTPANGAKAFNHLLGECGVTVFGTPELASAYRPDFPRSLSGAPFLLPTGNTALRRSLDQWFDAENISPKIQAEIEDSALLKTFGSGGTGLFVAPSAVEEEIQRQYDVEAIGRIDSVRERFYAITERRKLKHPAVSAILENVGKKPL
ncbi:MULTISPECIES: transcriptional activator NhaR [unclassified Methylocaldum]|uniref:transcriptional activator NhaR n=1 Tax=unclassified Methylocaldum TaxID=2622260 RepID=UPI000A32088A|nr:transcriptional activator NhaR [Methylocaldum sp. RMAD-M]MBP1151426.1 LysR family transcriptional activator of nhaA [Methylocaldum sp. RMAD-M]